MKRIITFVTTNKGKLQSLKKWLPETEFVIIQKKLDLPEVQSKNVEVVAKFKAMYAYKKLNAPVLVQDSSFHIHALEGFPGPHIKYVIETLGPHGILRLMDGVNDRDCHFEHALAYAVSSNEIKIFKKNYSIGRLSYNVDENNPSYAWSELWKIYIPAWSDYPISSIPKNEIEKNESNNNENSEFYKFCTWIMKNK